MRQLCRCFFSAKGRYVEAFKIAMRVGIIQPSFIPWRGYFDFIASVDLFIFFDDVQYSKGSWRNRNLIKGAHGSRWLTVPVRHRSLDQLICETEIDDSQDWRAHHLALWRDEYAEAPFFCEVERLLGTMGQGVDRTISQLDNRLVRVVCDFLGIHTPMVLSSTLKGKGKKTDRLINLLRAVGGTTYLSGPSAEGYLEKEKFREEGIGLEYKTYDYDVYPQLWGKFEGTVTVLDLIANCGPDSAKYLRSKVPNKIIVPEENSRL